MTFLWHQEEQIMSELSLLVASCDCKANLWILEILIGIFPCFLSVNRQKWSMAIHLVASPVVLYVWSSKYKVHSSLCCLCVCPFPASVMQHSATGQRNRNALLDHLVLRWSRELKTESVQTIILLNVCPPPSLPLSLCASATSAGSPHGLDNTNGGVCRSRSMKLVLRVGQSEYFMSVCQSWMCEWEREILDEQSQQSNRSNC